MVTTSDGMTQILSELVETQNFNFSAYSKNMIKYFKSPFSTSIKTELDLHSKIFPLIFSMNS